jgi:uncharacterized protein YuzE
MKATYDPVADAVYIYLVDHIGPGDVKATYSLDPVEEVGQIYLDFDTAGRLVGIEILDASKKVPTELLRNAQIIG